MIGRLATAALALGASIGGLYGGTIMTLQAGDEAAENDRSSQSSILRTDLMATPLVTSGGIYGYIVGRYVIFYDSEIRAERDLPLTIVVNHAVNRYFYSQAAQTFWLDGPLGVNEIADGLEMAINDAAGAPIVTALSIRQLDYLQSPEIRQPVISFDR